MLIAASKKRRCAKEAIFISFNAIAEKSSLALYIFLTLLTVSSRLDQMFSDAFSKDHQLIRADPKHSLYLACALMVRGNVQVSDLRRNIERSEHRSFSHSASSSSSHTETTKPVPLSPKPLAQFEKCSKSALPSAPSITYGSLEDFRLCAQIGVFEQVQLWQQ